MATTIGLQDGHDYSNIYAGVSDKIEAKLQSQPDDVMNCLSDSESLFGTSPTSHLPQAMVSHFSQPVMSHGNEPTVRGSFPSAHTSDQAAAGTVQVKTSTWPDNGGEPDALESMCYLSMQTVIGVSEILGHTLEDRTGISEQQDPELGAQLQRLSNMPLRSSSQRPLFTVAPLDVLVTRDATTGRCIFHIIEINGTGIAGLSNMPDSVVGTVMRSFSELPTHLAHIQDPLIMVASSGQESTPPVSRTMHEKALYIEALRRGFQQSNGRRVHTTNMMRLEKEPHHLPPTGPVCVLGYMKQFRRHLTLGPQGQLLLFGRQVHAAINDRFVLNICHQFEHQVDFSEFMGFNMGFTAGADKGVAYTLYNSFFNSVCSGGKGGANRFPCMAPCINFARACTRDQLVQEVQEWLFKTHRPVVIKPQGTGCGHGIEFFFGPETREEVCSKVDASMQQVTKSYDLSCGGLPYTVCEYLDTASVSDAAAKRHDGRCPVLDEHPHPMAGHKFELRIVVYRDGDNLQAYPSIAKVAREVFDPLHPSRSGLINNITSSAKETSQEGIEFMLPLCNTRTLELLGVGKDELGELCAAATAFIAHVVNQVQDAPGLFGLPEGARRHPLQQL